MTPPAAGAASQWRDVTIPHTSNDPEQASMRRGTAIALVVLFLVIVAAAIVQLLQVS